MKIVPALFALLAGAVCAVFIGKAMMPSHVVVSEPLLAREIAAADYAAARSRHTGTATMTAPVVSDMNDPRYIHASERVHAEDLVDRNAGATIVTTATGSITTANNIFYNSYVTTDAGITDGNVTYVGVSGGGGGAYINGTTGTVVVTYNTSGTVHFVSVPDQTPHLSIACDSDRCEARGASLDQMREMFKRIADKSVPIEMHAVDPHGDCRQLHETIPAEKHDLVASSEAPSETFANWWGEVPTRGPALAMSEAR